MSEWESSSEEEEEDLLRTMFPHYATRVDAESLRRLSAVESQKSVTFAWWLWQRIGRVLMALWLPMVPCAGIGLKQCLDGQPEVAVSNGPRPPVGERPGRPTSSQQAPETMTAIPGNSSLKRVAIADPGPLDALAFSDEKIGSRAWCWLESEQTLCVRDRVSCPHPADCLEIRGVGEAPEVEIECSCPTVFLDRKDTGDWRVRMDCTGLNGGAFGRISSPSLELRVGSELRRIEGSDWLLLVDGNHEVPVYSQDGSRPTWLILTGAFNFMVESRDALPDSMEVDRALERDLVLANAPAFVVWGQDGRAVPVDIGTDWPCVTRAAAP